MHDNCFDAPLFIRSGKRSTINVHKHPLFLNDGGVPAFFDELPTGAVCLPVARANPDSSMGMEHPVPQVIDRTDNLPWGIATQLDFAGAEIAYLPMWATQKTAAAFGITLVRPGEAVRLASATPELSLIAYEYGAFAGHQSPYQGTPDTLHPVVCTDLEQHDFPHVFCSTDRDLPLVISVGRYWQKRDKIFLADLWVRQGDALYIPPMSHQPRDGSLCLHGNRNSALACWGDIHHRSIDTHSLLQVSGEPISWFWNGKPTVHSKPPVGEQV